MKKEWGNDFIQFILSKEQQDLVTSNIGLVYNFLYQYKNIDEYSTLNNIDHMGIAMEALCLAAYTYDPNKSNFSTYAYKCMESKYISAKNSEFADKRVPIYLTISLDDKLDEYEIDNFYYEFEKKIETKDLLEHIKELLSEKEYQVFSCHMNGYTMREIATKLQYSHQNIHKIMNRCKKKIIEYFKYTNIYNGYV